jgi:fatty acid synthase subunit alpha, fungi type
LLYKEVDRDHECNTSDYVSAMAKGSDLTNVNLDPSAQLATIKQLLSCSTNDEENTKLHLDELKRVTSTLGSQPLPFLLLKKRTSNDPQRWDYCPDSTKVYLDTLADIAHNGITFEGQCALITGCGKGSIGVEVLKALLSGGAQVIITTSRFSKSVTEFYRSIYEEHGSKGSRLVCVPFNGGSVQDIRSLVKFIYDPVSAKGLGWDLDIVIPFAAISEQGREINNIDDRSELAHRVMMTNVLRLLGEIKIFKASSGCESRPAAVLLPLSPNHGTFGGDGLYGESKLGLGTNV